MKLLDLSKFEKVSEDKHTATMRHKDGHTMTILIGQLPKIHQEQLKRIKMAGGGVAAPAVDDDDDTAPVTGAAGDPAVEQAPSPDMSAAQEMSAQPLPDQTMPGNLTNPQNAAEVPAKAVEMAGKAADLGQSIDTAAAKGQLELKQQAERNAQDILDRQNATVAEMKAHTDAFDKWNRENPADSNRYWNSMTSDQKTGTAIGLFLGGLGGSNNPAMDYLNKQIDRDIDSQKQNAARQNNVYAAYQHLYQDENVSTALTKVSLNDKLVSQAEQMAATLGTPQAAKNAMILKANTLKENADLLQKASFIRNGSGGSPSAGAPGPGAAAEIGAGAGQKQVGQGDPLQPITSPNAPMIARQLAARAASGDPIAAAQLPRVQEQYARAQKADEVLNRAGALFDQLQKSSNSTGGWMSRQIGDVGGGGDGMIGAATNLAGKFAGDLTSQFNDKTREIGDKLGVNDHNEPAPKEAELNRSYNTAAQELSDMLRSVFPAIGGGELHSKLNGILPENGDTPKQIQAKKQAFSDLVRTSGEFNMLKDNGMLR